MPGRVTPLINGEIYHIYNRGSEKRDIFNRPRDYKRFKQTMYYYQFAGPKLKLSLFATSKLDSFNPDPTKKLVEILCFCLMPNHFHFMVKQLIDGGISSFVSQLCNSYTKFFNTKYNRVGALLQGTFKSVHVESEERLIHLSRYIHLNPVVSGICKMPEDYSWSSFIEYQAGEALCSTNLVLDLFPSKEKYKEFTDDQIDYGKTLETAKHQLIDLEN